MTDERLKQLMEQVGMPNSISLYGALQQAENEGFQAGAASRDTEIESLKNELDDALDCKEGVGPTALSMVVLERDQLRAQINSLREALEKILSQESDNGSILSAGNCAEIAYEALASTPEQSLTEYRNKVLEDCAKQCEAPNEYGFHRTCYESAEAIRTMKEQP